MKQRRSSHSPGHIRVLTFCDSASVDLETDGKIQRTIQSEFKKCTVLCIARKFSHLNIARIQTHPSPDRLRTIISYDRILVLDAGTVAVSAILIGTRTCPLTFYGQEFDTPETLFKNEEGIFRSMCEGSNISLDDIRRES